MAISTTALLIGSLLVGAGATIDANKAAKHQNKVNAEANDRALKETTRLETEKLNQAERLAQQNLSAQRSAQAASIAQANKAAGESKALMDKQLKSADENMNRALQKRPNTARIQDEAAQAGKAGASGTMLTGSQGIDPSKLQLGRNSLLGA